MAIDTTSRRTRRAILTGAAGAVAATAAASIAGPLSAEAATQHVTYTNDQTGADVLTAQSVAKAGFPNSGQGVAVTGISDSRIGVLGSCDNGIGVQGQSLNDFGVVGNSNGSYGVFGQGGTDGVHGQAGPVGHGVSGYSGTGAGVFGTSSSGPGIGGTSSTGRGGVFSSPVAQLRLVPSAAASHPASGLTGDLFVDKAGRLWFCKAGGNPATWKQVSLV